MSCGGVDALATSTSLILPPDGELLRARGASGLTFDDGAWVRGVATEAELTELVRAMSSKWAVERTEAADRIAAMDDDAAIDTLLTTMTSSKSTVNQRTAAAGALGHAVRALGPRREDVVDKLVLEVQRVGEPFPSIVSNAARSLVELSPARARVALFAAVDGGALIEPDGVVSGLEYLVSRDPSSVTPAVPRLKRLLGIQRSRDGAAGVLAKIDSEDAFRLLLGAVDSAGQDQGGLLAAIGRSPLVDAHSDELVETVIPIVRGGAADSHAAAKLLARV